MHVLRAISRSSSTVGSRTAGDLTFAGRNGAQAFRELEVKGMYP
ncbi:hypothetical protein predicted by Glimmer/Critica [Bacteroides ovatus V975]|nr:hypothetical protein [Bacteroides ovatus]SCV07488.1 hypothetical protein predicted by Glimmer/Critica [Bacteroides ovatus V975]